MFNRSKQKSINKRFHLFFRLRYHNTIYLFFFLFPGKVENNGVVNITCWPLAIFLFLALTLTQRKHHCGFFVPCNLRSTGNSKSGKAEKFCYNINLLCWHVTYKGWYAKNEKRRYTQKKVNAQIILPILLCMLSQHRLNRYFDKKKQLKKVCVATASERNKMIIIWYHHGKWNCVAGYVMSILWEALRAKVTNYLTSIFYPDASKPMVDGFCSNFQGSSRICSMVHPRSFKLLCQKEAK